MFKINRLRGIFAQPGDRPSDPFYYLSSAIPNELSELTLIVYNMYVNGTLQHFVDLKDWIGPSLHPISKRNISVTLSDSYKIQYIHARQNASDYLHCGSQQNCIK